MNSLRRSGWPAFIGHLAFAGIVVAVDQFTKQVAYAHLLGQPSVEILPFFRLELVFNEGAAFGFLSDAGGWQHRFLVTLAVVVSLVLVIWLWRLRRQPDLLSWGLALVLGGALGNLIDRISHQYVIDFIVLHYAGWHFPAFNIADGAITLGALALIADSFGWRPGAGGRRRKDL